MKLQARLLKRFAAGPESAGFTLDVDLTAEPGITVIFGASGGGKSLTLDCIAGFSRPDSGRILLGDAILYDHAARVNLRPQERECGYVFQNHALFPHMTLRENLAFAAEKRPRLERYRRVNEMIERFRLAEVAGRKPAEVSGGQKQRCSIARALIGTPQILLLDEPSRGMDPGLRGEFHDLVRELRGDLQIPLLLVTHDLDEAVALGDRMVIYEAGRLMQSGTPRAILDRPANLAIARLLGFFNILPAEVLALDPGRNLSRVLVTVDGSARELAGTYFPGYLLGDRASLLVRASDLRVHAGPGENRLRLRLESFRDHGHLAELRFAGGVTALVARHEYEAHRDLRDWFVELPGAALRLVNG